MSCPHYEIAKIIQVPLFYFLDFSREFALSVQPYFHVLQGWRKLCFLIFIYLIHALVIFGEIIKLYPVDLRRRDG